MQYSTWKYPDLKEERDEFERVAVELGIFPDSLQEAAQNGTLVTLDDHTWSDLQNTDSWETVDMALARQYAKQYGRDADHIASGFIDESPMPAPIVMKVPGGMATLISGNIRLMVARALGIRPKVLMFDMPQESDRGSRRQTNLHSRGFLCRHSEDETDDVSRSDSPISDPERYHVRFRAACKRLGLSVESLGTVFEYEILLARSPWQEVRPGLLVLSGFHGEEPGGPLGVLRFLETADHSFLKRLNFAVIPLINPDAHANGKRYNRLDQISNQAFAFKPEEGPSLEGQILLDHISLLSRLASTCVLDLHEDWEGVGCYIYPTTGDPPTPLHQVLLALGAEFFGIEPNQPVTDDAVTRDGYAIFHGGGTDGSFSELFHQMGTPYVVVTETPGKRILDARIAANAEFITETIRWLTNPVHQVRTSNIRPKVSMFNKSKESCGRLQIGRNAVEARDYVICWPDDGLLYVEVPNFDHLRNLLLTQRWRGEPHLRTRQGYVPYHGGGIAFDFLALRLRGVLPTWYPRDNARQDSALQQVLDDGIYVDEREARRHRQQASYARECEWVGPPDMRFNLDDVKFAWLGSRPRTRPTPAQVEDFRELFPDLELHEGPPHMDKGSVLAKLRQLADSFERKS